MRLLKEPIVYGTPVEITGGFHKGNKGVVLMVHDMSFFGFGDRYYFIQNDEVNFLSIPEKDITPTL